MEDMPVRHIAFIMDGNGRWAKKRLMPREYGHKIGAETFRKIVEYCGDIGIKTVTVYAFSTENWKRPKSEIEALFTLFAEYIDYAAKTFAEKDIHIVFIGDKSTLPEKLASRMTEIEHDSRGRGRTLNVAINYGGRSEIVHAVNALLAEGKSAVTEEDISSHLYTAGSPDPDLIVRTGGEYRTSNFLMWQSAYSELYITDRLWPDMTPGDVDAAIDEYKRRNRRYGGL